jgi:hypothetical protein
MEILRSHHKHSTVAVGKHAWLTGQATNTMNTDTKETGGNSQVSSQEEMEEDQGGDTIDAATVVAARRHHPVSYDGEEQHLAHSQATTTTPHLGGAGVAGMPSNRRWRRRHSSRR